ncbi:MAG TPA: S1/P1 nuclease, partial [Allosphingosinicella sp.]
AISTPPGDANGLLTGVSAEQRTAFAAGSVTDWAKESWQVSHDFVYATAFGDPCGPKTEERVVMTEDQTQRLIPVAREQILKGGLRLARMLDEALAKN